MKRHLFSSSSKRADREKRAGTAGSHKPKDSCSPMPADPSRRRRNPHPRQVGLSKLLSLCPIRWPKPLVGNTPVTPIFFTNSEQGFASGSLLEEMPSRFRFVS